MTHRVFSLVLCLILVVFTGCADSKEVRTTGAGNNANESEGQGGTGGDPVVEGEGGSGGDPVVGGAGGNPVVDGQGGSGGDLVVGGTGGNPVVDGQGGAGGNPVVDGEGGAGGDPVVGGAGGNPVVEGEGGSGGDPVVEGGTGGDACERQDELCNNADDDCDGNTDEGIAEGVCSAGEGVCERQGVNLCIGGVFVCDAQPGAPSVAQDEGQDFCDAQDNDCDGQTDENFVGALCSDGTGACQVDGQQQCVNGGEVCDAQAGQGVAELCNGVDDDCDGFTDEAFADLGEDCAVGGGACEAEGEWECSEDELRLVCSAQVPPEVCDGVDNDCDGNADEGFNVGDECVQGEAACRFEGEWECGEDGQAVCVSQEQQPFPPELCDGEDNDCDGVVDEGLVGRVEFCDGVDNNCIDGIDEGFGLGEACQVGVGACAAEGQLACDPGDRSATICGGVPLDPQEEACNGLDDNCNGEVDDVEDDALAFDNYNCGSCGEVCPADQFCSEGVCQDPAYVLFNAESYHHICALHQNSEMHCWGNYSERVPVLGSELYVMGGEGFTRIPQTIGNAAFNSALIENNDPRTAMDKEHLIATTERSACSAIHEIQDFDPKPYCWGNNDYGGLGNVTAAPSLQQCEEGVNRWCAVDAAQISLSQNIVEYDQNEFPGEDGGIQGTFLSMDTGSFSGIDDRDAQMCGRTTAGWIYCWEYNLAQREQDGELVIRAVAQSDDLLGFECNDGTCCLHQSSDPQVMCWYNVLEWGGFGSGYDPGFSSFPTEVDGTLSFLNNRVLKLSVGSTHLCVLEENGNDGHLSIRCAKGIEDNLGEDRQRGFVVDDLPDQLDELRDLAGGADLHCAAFPQSVYCWGDLGVFGFDTSSATQIEDFDIEDDEYQQLSIYQSPDLSIIRICALKRSGNIQCISNDGLDWNPQLD